MKSLKIMVAVFVFACLALVTYLPMASAEGTTASPQTSSRQTSVASTQTPIRTSMLSKIPGYRITNDYGYYFTDSHIYIKNIIASIENQTQQVGANACIGVRILLIGHMERNYTQRAAFVGYCELVTIVPKQ